MSAQEAKQPVVNVEAALNKIEEIVTARIRDGQISGVDIFTPEQQQDTLMELAVLYVHNQIAYQQVRNNLKAYFGGVSVKAIDAEVKKYVEAGSPQALEQADIAVVDELIDIARDEAVLWHDPTRRGYARFGRDAHLEYHKISSLDFEDWLADKFGEEHQRLSRSGNLVPQHPSRDQLREAIHRIGGYCRRGDECDPKIRIKASGSELWIDGGGHDWSGFKVTADGWKVVDQLTVEMVRGNGMKSLPIPVRGGDIQDLRRFVNVADEDFVLFVGDMATTLNPFGNFLTTIFAGPAGSGKTTTTRFFRALTDPNEVDTRRAAGVRDLLHGAANTHVIGLENVSAISAELSDTICSLNTGTGYAEREYYKQGVEVMWKPHCPVLINGIPYNLAERSDLADRTITFVFDHLGENSRSDDLLKQQFVLAAPKLFGALLDGIVGALAMRREFGGDNDAAAAALLDGWHPRFSDAVVWAEAACQAMGFQPGEFVEAYRNNQLVAFRYTGDHDPICIGVRKLIVKHGNWRGYPAELCKTLKPYVGAMVLPDEVWLARKLPALAPVLMKLDGIRVQMHKRLMQDDNRNGIIIERVGVGRGRYFREQFPQPDPQSNQPDSK